MDENKAERDTNILYNVMDCIKVLDHVIFTTFQELFMKNIPQN